MIKKVKFGSIFNCEEKHVVFAINKEGISDSVYTRKLVDMGFSELEKGDSNKLGSVISKDTQKALGADYIEMKKEMQNSSKKLVLYKEV